MKKKVVHVSEPGDMENHIQSFSLTSFFTIGFIRAALLVVLVLLLNSSLRLPAAILLFILAATEGARWWSRCGLRHLKINRGIRPGRLFPGEEAGLEVRICNNKLIPAILDWSQPMGPELQAFAGEDGAAGEKDRVSGRGMLLRHTSIVAKRKMHALKRGCFRLPSLRVSSRDGLGLYATHTFIDDEKWLIVYPRLLPLPELGLSPADIIGERPDRRYILPDPIRVRGLRDYTPDMPSRLIHWKASAHKNRLLAKELEPSCSLNLCIALDVSVFAQDPPQTEVFEKAVSVAASLADWADSQGVPFGMLVNGSRIKQEGPLVMPVSGGTGQVLLALESLARLELNPLLPMEELFRAQYAQLPWGSTLFLITCGNAVYAAPPGVRKMVVYRCAGD